MIKIHPIAHHVNLKITNPVDAENLSDSNLLEFFDKDGYELTLLEKLYYEQQGFRVVPYTAYHPGLFESWIEFDHPNLKVDHSCALYRCSFDGEALEQLQQHRSQNYRLGWLADVKHKWGLDFNLDFCDETRSIEVIHLEADAPTLDLILEEQYKVEQLVQNTDWLDAAEQIWAHRDEWMPLRGWYAQAHWKAKYFGLERPWY